MAGLNFQTQTIINTNVDPDSNSKDNSLFKSGSGCVIIKRDFVFHKNKEGVGKVLSVRKKVGANPKMCKATIDFKPILEALKDSNNDVAKTYCRLDVYLGVEGAEPFIYSTPWVSKGMPFWMDFTIDKVNVASDATSAATALVKKLVAEIKKNHMFQCDKDLVIPSESTTSLVLTGANEFQRFKKINIVKYDIVNDTEEVIASIEDKKVTVNERGANGFGTYSQIIKDLRLPTAANYQWSHVRNVETPVVGALYDQYIIDYAAPATNDGLSCVGQKLTSTTTHVFWVKHDLASAWEKVLDAGLSTSAGVLSSDNPVPFSTLKTQTKKEGTL